MILYPNAKINLGLNIVAKRPDGYHDIETVMVATDWRDILEIVPAAGPDTTLTTYGRPVDCPPEKNLVMKAYRALADTIGGLPPAEIYLEKVIPDGAGLGGGSADAAFTLLGLNEVFNLGLPEDALAKVAAAVGADCPFFIYNRPALCTGTGTDLTHGLKIDLADRTVLIAKPRVAAVSTKEAYAGVVPSPAPLAVAEAIAAPVENWHRCMHNDFEDSIFPKLPEVKAVKDRLYAAGATYASMSGSGAAVFGIFDDAKMAHIAAEGLTDCDIHIGKVGNLNV